MAMDMYLIILQGRSTQYTKKPRICVLNVASSFEWNVDMLPRLCLFRMQSEYSANGVMLYQGMYNAGNEILM